jgi:hypothetical protein
MNIGFRRVAVAAMLLIGTAQGAKGAFTFDPDGSSGGGSYEVGSFDFAPGNALSYNFALGDSWTLYYQASLGSLVDTAGGVIAGTGLNANYEITAVAGITVRTVFANETTFFFELDPNGTTNFLQLYYDENVNANPLAGTGYNDGTLIMNATAGADLQGIFSVFSDLVVPLDQFGGNNWAGIFSPMGVGAFATSADITYYNTDFFQLGDQEILSKMFVNSSQVTPYRQTNPSLQFWDGTSFIETDVGQVNIFDGPSALTQADANASFQVDVVPEASSLALLGLAAACGLGIRKIRSRRAT